MKRDGVMSGGDGWRGESEGITVYMPAKSAVVYVIAVVLFPFLYAYFLMGQCDTFCIAIIIYLILIMESRVSC